MFTEWQQELTQCHMMSVVTLLLSTLMTSDSKLSSAVVFWIQHGGWPAGHSVSVGLQRPLLLTDTVYSSYMKTQLNTLKLQNLLYFPLCRRVCVCVIIFTIWDSYLHGDKNTNMFIYNKIKKSVWSLIDPTDGDQIDRLKINMFLKLNRVRRRCFIGPLIWVLNPLRVRPPHRLLLSDASPFKLHTG